MVAYAALLRAVNLGGHGKIAMSNLRDVVAELGYSDVATYIQSGNVVFTTAQRSGQKIEAAIERALAMGAALETTVMVRTTRDLRQVLDTNPFASKQLGHTKLIVVFLKAKSKRQGEIDVTRYGPERLIAEGRELFIHYPNGQGRSKLTNAVIEREVGVPGTARNWNTVNKLLELAEQRT